MRHLLTTFVFLLAYAQQGQHSSPPLADLVRHYEYNRRAPLDVRQVRAEKHTEAIVHDITFRGVKGDRVPAYLVVPRSTGRHPAIVWGHWMMDGSPHKNRTEFLDEALLLARSGVVSLMIDIPLVRPGWVKPKDPLDPRNAFIQQQTTLDMRRALDLLLSRKDVDPKRVAYVGHSYDAAVGGLLAGVEPRLSAFVLMAGSLDDYEWLDLQDEDAVKFREQVGSERLRRALEEYNWTNPYFFMKAQHAPLLLEWPRKEMSTEREKLYRGFLSQPFEIKIYEGATHALNASARSDRVAWLAKQLSFSPPDAQALAAVPQIN